MKTLAVASVVAAAFLAACQVTVKETQTPEDSEPQGDEPTAAPTAPAADPGQGGVLGKIKGQKICTDMGCMNGLNVDVEPQAWPKGKYKIAITADGKSSVCEGTLPLPACDKGKALSCKGDVEVMVGESGCALPPEQQGFGAFNFKGNPAKVTIEVSRNGKSVGKADFTPAYKTVQPNGPDCEPTCNHASEKMTVK